MKTLNKLQRGQSSIIHSILGDGPVPLRLMAMQLLPGTRVTLEHVAPLGDPVAIKVGASKISLRKTEASCVVLADVARK